MAGFRSAQFLLDIPPLGRAGFAFATESADLSAYLAAGNFSAFSILESAQMVLPR
jgi:hypothetical protein